MDSRVVGSELVYEGAICRVRKVALATDAGESVARDLIEFADAVVIVPVLDDGRLVLIRNERFAVGEELWEFPAGKLEEGEQPDPCAARELAEETGYTAGRLERLGGFYTCPGAATEYIHAFGAADLRRGRQALEGYERIRVEVVPGERVRRMIAAGEIHDAKSIAAHALWRMREGG